MHRDGGWGQHCLFGCDLCLWTGVIHLQGTLAFGLRFAHHTGQQTDLVPIGWGPGFAVGQEPDLLCLAEQEVAATGALTQPAILGHEAANGAPIRPVFKGAEVHRRVSQRGQRRLATGRRDDGITSDTCHGKRLNAKTHIDCIVTFGSVRSAPRQRVEAG